MQVERDQAGEMKGHVQEAGWGGCPSVQGGLRAGIQGNRESPLGSMLPQGAGG